MFQLETESDKQFYQEQKASLDEEQRAILDTYEKSLLYDRHVELQILEWENQRYHDHMNENSETKDMIVFESSDAKQKIDEKEKVVYELLSHQKTLNEQINELMQLKQPVQRETTYIMPNRKNPSSTNNISLTPTPPTPKLSYYAFCKQLYSVDSIRVEHLIKHETDKMVQGLSFLEDSLHKILHDIDAEEMNADMRKQIENVDAIIRSINNDDRLSYLTVVEHVRLKKRLYMVEKEKNKELAEIQRECEIVEKRIRSEQLQCQHDIDIIKQRHHDELHVNTAQLYKQKQRLQGKINLLLRHNLHENIDSSQQGRVVLNVLNHSESQASPAPTAAANVSLNVSRIRPSSGKAPGSKPLAAGARRGDQENEHPNVQLRNFLRNKQRLADEARKVQQLANLERTVEEAKKV